MARSYIREARRRGLGTRRERIGPIVERLAEEHSDAEIALHFSSDVELLISVMLSAQTTDVNVNRVTEKLFVKYRRPEDYLAVPQEELEQDVFQTGFYRQKTKSIRGAMRMLLESELAHLGCKARVALEIESVPAMLDLVQHDGFHAVLSLNAIESSGNADALQVRPITQPRLAATLWIATSAQRPRGPLIDEATRLVKELVVRQWA